MIRITAKLLYNDYPETCGRIAVTLSRHGFSSSQRPHVLLQMRTHTSRFSWFKNIAELEVNPSQQLDEDLVQLYHCYQLARHCKELAKAGCRRKRNVAITAVEGRYKLSSMSNAGVKVQRGRVQIWQARWDQWRAGQVRK